MKRIGIILALATLTGSVLAQSASMTSTDAFNSGMDFAKTGKGVAAGTINGTTGSATLPYYGTDAPASAVFQGGRNALGGVGSAKLVECQSSRASTAFQQQECDAVNFLSQNSTQRKKYPLDKNDPLLARSISIMNDPTKFAPGLNGTSTECTDKTSMSPATYNQEFCDQWLTPEDKICSVSASATLDKDAMFSCRETRLTTTQEQCSSVKYSDYRIDAYQSAAKVSLTCGGDWTIQSWYNSYAGRCADTGGLAYWVSLLPQFSYNYSNLFSAWYTAYIQAEGAGAYGDRNTALCYPGGVYIPGTPNCQYQQVVMTPTYQCQSLLSQSSGGDNSMLYPTLTPTTCGGDPTIQQWYQQYDSRCADVAGMTYWTNQLMASFGGNYAKMYDAWNTAFLLAGGRGSSWPGLCTGGDEYVFNSTNCRRRVYSTTNACRVLSSSCVDSTPVKYFGGVAVSVSQVGGCWERQDSYECSRATTDTSCSALAAYPSCKQLSTSCESTTYSGACQTEKRTYRCDDASMATPAGATRDGTVGEITALSKDDSLCKPYAENAECGQVTDVCVEPKTTKVIDGVSVYQDCWRWERKYTCFSGSYSEDCQALVNKGCEQKSLSCMETTPTGRCALQHSEYSCKIKDGVLTTIRDCGTQMLCAPGSDGKQQCFNTGYPPDMDFGQAAVMMEAAREAGVYFDPASIRIFKGVDERCKKKLFGLANCCKGGAGAKTNNDVMSSVVKQGLSNTAGYTKEVGSKYMYDFMYSSGNSYLQEKALDAMALSGGFFDDYTVPQSGFDPSFSFYGLTATTGSVPATGMLGGSVMELGSLGSFNFYFDPWSFAIAIAIQVITEMMQCEQSEQMLGMHRDAQLCVSTGSYCSSRVSIINTCIETTESYCCFNSRLARIINTQGRVQLGRGWGGGKSPDCSGFTPEELQRIDFSKIDFSEFIAEIMAAVKLPDANALGARIQQTVTDKTKSYYEQ